MARIALIPGDGIGVEVTREAARLLRALGEARRVPVELTEWDLGAERYLRTGSAITDEEMAQLETEYDAIFLGAIGDPRVPDNAHARAILLGLRFRLDLYVNLRPVRLYHPRLSPLRDVRNEDVDLVIFRENTEGVYVGMGGNFKKGTPDEVAIEEDVNTRKGVERIIRAAFEYAQTRGRRRVTLTDKANAMPHGGGLYRRVFAEVAREFDGIETDAVYADALALDLVRRPARYDVIVAPNLFGDLLSDLAAALAGGLGLAPSASLHPGRCGLYEPVHGSAPDIAGTGRANPLAAFLTVALLLEHLGHAAEAERVERAVRAAVAEGCTTPDLGGTMRTEAVGERVVQRVLDAG
jgi:3-isopropylmalate dehydrogenase